jgi:hypothetical protein
MSWLIPGGYFLALIGLSGEATRHLGWAVVYAIAARLSRGCAVRRYIAVR